MNNTECPLAAGSFRNWIKLVIQHPIENKYWVRMVFVSFVSFLFIPFRMLNRLLYNKKISKIDIKKDPIFIIGHFRSGTTYLQNLLAQDNQFGYVSTTQTLLPEMFLLGKWVNNLLRIFLPSKRPMDNVQMAPEFPEEPEHALGNMSPCSFYHGFCFPQQMLDYYKKYVLLEDIDTKAINKLKKDYNYIIRAASYYWKGKQLFLKNPPDTARIPLLLEMYPNAKFIYLYRNPYVLFPSIKNFYSKSIADWQFNSISKEELEENIFSIYESMIGKYEETKHSIPPSNLTEVRFEDLETHPLLILETIYNDLHLNGFEKARNNFKNYITSQKNYEKNTYKLSKELTEKISERWKADIQNRNYQPSPTFVS